MNPKLEQALKKYRIEGDKLTEPALVFNAEALAADIKSFREEGVSQAFIRRRIVFFMDGYRYALRAAEKRWGFNFGFYETGAEPVKRVFFSGKFNETAAKIWLKRMEDEPDFGDSLVEELKTIVELEKYLASSVPKRKLEKAEIKEHLLNHLSWWVQFFDLAFLWFCTDNIREVTDQRIKESWSGTPESLKVFLDSVYRPMALPLSSIEQRDFIELCSFDSKEKEVALQEHISKYRHLSLHNIDDEYFDLSYYRGRMKALEDKTELQAQKELLQHADKEIVEAAELLEQADISPELKKRISFIRWFMYLRTESVDHMMLVNSAYKAVFESLAEMFGLPIDAVLNMTYKEIMDGLQDVSSIDKTSIVDRVKNGYGYFIGHTTEALVTGDDMTKLSDQVIPAQTGEAVSEIKGQTAYAGKVTGIARIIIDRRDAGQLKQGEILVTAMTSPDFVPAMKISGGIITNEGGILCHAAIMSRELRKPCIIGTKIATDAIKTGQTVELDADTGVIKILK